MELTNFINNNKFIISPKISGCQEQRFKINSEVTFRDESVSLDQNFIIRLYLFLKSRESNIDLSQQDFDSFVAKTQQILQTLDIDKAMIYVHNTLNVKTRFDKKNTRFVF